MMNILIPLNDAYFNAAMIMLKSLFANNNEKINLYIFYSELDTKKIKGVQKWIKKNTDEVHIIKIDDTIMRGVPVSSFSKETYFRLFAPSLLPRNVHKILYLDTDMIINDDISDIYHIDMKDNLFMAVPDTSLGLDEVKKKLNMGKNIYVNAGFLLMNLDLLREEFDLQKLLLFAKKHPDQVKNCDQDLINKFYYKKIGTLEWTYNCEARFHDLHDLFNYLLFYFKKLKQIKVVHYMGYNKPWKEGYHGKYLFLFYKYSRNTSLQKVAARNFLFWPISVSKFFIHQFVNQI